MRHLRLAAQLRQRLQAAAEEFGVATEEVVVLQQQLHPLVVGEVEPQARAGAHGGHQRVRHRQVADLLAFALHDHRPRRIEGAQPLPHQRVEALLCRLRLRAFDPARPVVVESESKKVGNLAVPDALARMAA
ncbi:MAG: hypothetical protein EOO24_59580, partial [Comamonadaceae bacterium]